LLAILLSYGMARVLLAGDAEAREEEYEWLRKLGVNEY
jgi:beta-lactamase superfamily II metal-dependent hydrolase